MEGFRESSCSITWQRNSALRGGMAITSKQVVALSIFVSLSFAALMLPNVLCESGSQTTPINYKPISSSSPPCSKSSQENCVTHSPPVNELQRPCNPSDHCRVGQSLMGTESVSKAQVSAATKQVIALRIVVPLMLFALMMTTVLCGSHSLAAAVNVVKGARHNLGTRALKLPQVQGTNKMLA